MKRYIVTGPHENVTLEQIRFVAKVVSLLRDVGEFTTGGAREVDTAAALAALAWHPNAHHRVVLPDAPYHPVWTAPWEGLVEKVQTHGGYMARNGALVTYGEVLLAFPRTMREVQRSGTWSTIRRARAAGLDIRYFPLDSLDSRWSGL